MKTFGFQTLLAVALTISILASNDVRAEPVTFYFEGVVETVIPEVFPGVTQDTPFSGSYTFETTADNGNVPGSLYIYDVDQFSARLRVGPWELVSSPVRLSGSWSHIAIEDNVKDHDAFVTVAADLTGGPVVSEFVILLLTTNLNAITAGPPLTPPDVAAFIPQEGHSFQIRSLNYGNPLLFGRITALYLDSDKDGLANDKDACPYEDARGFDADRNGCIDSVGELVDNVQTLLEQGVVTPELSTSVLTKIEASQTMIGKENICAAVNQLSALKNSINAHRGKKISSEAADLLNSYTDNLIKSHQGQLPTGGGC